MRKKLFFGLFSAALLASGIGYAVTTNDATPALSPVTPGQAQTSADYVQLRANLNSNLGLEVISVNPTPIENLVEITTKQGLFYVSKDGQFFIQGKMFSIGENVVNLTEQSLAKVRLDGMKQFDNDMIVFPAKDEKHVITVFTDITCSYCRRMHDQITEYNKLGITVRYLAYPRSGVKDMQGNFSQGFKDLQSIWCHEDPAQALTKAKLGAQVAQRICDSKVEAEFNFGRQIGVTGTPAIILQNGLMLPGYRTPDDLAQILSDVMSES